MSSALILCVLGEVACTSWTVAIHGDETANNHYVVIQHNPGSDRLFDCYSRTNGKWDPQCKEVKRLRLRD